jgi:hypothetical protein
METLADHALEERSKQARMLSRLILRKFNEKMRRVQHGEVYATIASEFLHLPSLDNLDRLSTVYGYPWVRCALNLLDNLVFKEFFYEKVFLHPLWIKQFARLLDAAKPRPILRELLQVHNPRSP